MEMSDFLVKNKLEQIVENFKVRLVYFLEIFYAPEHRKNWNIIIAKLSGHFLKLFLTSRDLKLTSY